MSHHRIHDARDIWGVSNAQEMLTQRVASLAKRGIPVLLQGDGTPARKASDTLNVYVSDGRWVATCPECNGGTTYFPGTPWTLCPDCGKGYLVRFPKDKVELEIQLLQRPLGNRHMRLGETAKDLAKENAEHGYV